MNFEDINALLSKRGFHFTKSNIMNTYAFLKPLTKDELEICLIINNINGFCFDTASLSQLADTIERKFLFNGFRKVNLFFIIFSDNITHDKNYVSQNHPFWLIDTTEKKLMIFENQPDDYFNLRQDLESFLSSSPARKGLADTLPVITILLIAVNVIVFLFTSFHGGEDNTRYLLQHGAAYWKYIYEDHEYYRLLTCMFLHFDGEHLLNNMITLAVIGATIENVLGHFRFLSIYLLSGLGASFISSLYNMNNNPANTITVSAGASGAIFGILGALIIITLLSNKLKATIKPQNIFVIAVLSVLNGYMNSSIDNMAHIGGLLFGIILTFTSCLYRKNILK